MNNLKYWDQLKTPPDAALKKIAAGRMKGKLDINPQWRFMAMTDAFGPVGFGWKYTIDKMWLEPGSENQTVAFVAVSVCISDGTKWSEPIPGTGGSMFIAKEKSGLFTSDEAYKMATTDALSVAFKAIGVAADVYMRVFDGAKYPQKEPEKTFYDRTKTGIDGHIKLKATPEDLSNWWVKYIYPIINEFTETELDELEKDFVATIKLLTEMHQGDK